jgi:hypothetical protein
MEEEKVVLLVEDDGSALQHAVLDGVVVVLQDLLVEDVLNVRGDVCAESSAR